MIRTMSSSRKIFVVVNYCFLCILALLCIFPVYNILAVSFSSKVQVSAGHVFLWPKEFSLNSYKYVASQGQFFLSMRISVIRVVLGTLINMLLTLLVAYPLSKDNREFGLRTVYVWYFVITILFGGGLIPWYLTIKSIGLIDTIWALILPGAVPVFNVILLLNFFRRLPKELDESAKIDGASAWVILARIYAPLSMPALATLILFSAVGHWNAWFDGLILMNSTAHYPLSSYLQTIIATPDLSTLTHMSDPKSLKYLSSISDRTIRAAEVFVAMLPILLVYPFLQRFFIHGIVIGSVKE